jgi:hypothetical protein
MTRMEKARRYEWCLARMRSINLGMIIGVFFSGWFLLMWTVFP